MGFNFLCSMHDSVINQILHLIALIILVIGLWNHDWTLIIVAIVIAILGHIIQAYEKPKQKKKRR